MTSAKLQAVEFNVKCVSDIEWSEEGFDNLAIDPDRKILIQGLVKSHASLREKRPVDDFVAGKGSGLIINLFGTFQRPQCKNDSKDPTGPPGVGKTLTVEATSERKSCCADPGEPTLNNLKISEGHCMWSAPVI